MSFISELLTAGTGGAITGLVGNIFTSFTNIKLQKLKNEHEVNMISAETEAMKAEAAANIQITETQTQADLAIAENETFHETVKQNGKTVVSDEMILKLFDSVWTAWLGSILVFLLGTIKVLKAAIRPGITIYLMIITTWMTMQAYQIVELQQDAITVDDALSMYQQIVKTVIFLTVTCLTWWFGDRRVAKNMARLNDGNLQPK